MKDCTIIVKLKANKEQALCVLMERYTPYIATIIFRIGQGQFSIEDIEEMTSDVFFAVWKSRDRIEKKESLKPYIAEIARNIAKSKLLVKKHTLELKEGMLEGEGTDLVEDIVRRQEITFIKEIIEEFPEPDNSILRGYYVEEKKLKEIAKELLLPLSTVKSKVYRGKKEVKRRCQEGGIGYEG